MINNKFKRQYLFIFFLLLLYIIPLYLFAENSVGDMVDEQIERIWNVRQECADLDEFGRKTMKESMNILSLESECIPYLAAHLEWENDWMIRFWIVDLIGYIKAPRVLELLSSIIEDSSEDIEIRLRAVESLAQQEYPSAFNDLSRLHYAVEDESLRQKIEEMLKTKKKEP